MKALVAAIALVALPASAFAATSERDVLSHYADLAHAVYEDSLIAARDLQGAVNQFLADPTEENLAAARECWVAGTPRRTRSVAPTSLPTRASPSRARPSMPA